MTTWNTILVLMHARLLMTRNTFWQHKWWQKLVLLIILIGLGFFAYILYLMSNVTVQAVRSPEFARLLRETAALNPALPADPLVIMQATPSSLLFGASLMLIVSGFSTTLNALYLAGDLDMLLSRPIPMRAVFITKFFGGLLPQYGLLGVLLLPLLLGYGAGMEYGPGYHGVTLGILLLLPLLPTAISAILVMAVVRVIPARRAREIVSILGGIIAISFYVLSQFAPEVAPRLANVNNLRGLLTLNLPLFPSAWAGRALIAAGESAHFTLLTYGGLFLVLSILVFTGCVLLAERLYYAGWSNMAVQGGRIRRRRSPLHQPLPASNGPATTQATALPNRHPRIPSQIMAVFLKDWRIFPRDIRNIQQMIFPLALAGIWAFRLLTLPEGASSVPPDLRTGERSGSAFPDTASLLAWSSTGITFFLCMTVSNAIAGNSISREGRTFWLLKLAPISSLRILLGKLALAYLPYPLIGTPLLILLLLFSHASLGSFLIGWSLLLLLGLGNTCLVLGLGATFPRLDWENPQQQTTIQSGCLSFLLSPLYIGLVLAAVFGPPAAADLMAASGEVRLVVATLGWLIALCLTALVIWGSLASGARRLNRIEC